MCCRNKKKSSQQQAQLQKYINKDKNINQSQVLPKNSITNSVVLGNSDPNANTKPSPNQRASIVKILQKSQVRVNPIHEDQSVKGLFQGNHTQRIQLSTITRQHASYVRKDNYFDTSIEHELYLRNIQPNSYGYLGSHELMDYQSCTTPHICSFNYGQFVQDIMFVPKTTQYRIQPPNNNLNASFMGRSSYIPQVNQGSQIRITNINTEQNSKLKISQGKKYSVSQSEVRESGRKPIF